MEDLQIQLYLPPSLEGFDQVCGQVISLWVYLMKLYETTIVDGWNPAFTSWGW